MKRFLAAIGLTALVLAGNALGGGVTRASSDMTVLDCTTPSPYQLYEEMCGGTTYEDDGTGIPVGPYPVEGCLVHALKPTWQGGYLKGYASAGCTYNAHIYISGTLWKTSCPRHDDNSCPPTMMPGDNNPKRKTCPSNQYCEADPTHARDLGCWYYWSHVYADITGWPAFKAWSKDYFYSCL